MTGLLAQVRANVRMWCVKKIVVVDDRVAKSVWLVATLEDCPASRPSTFVRDNFEKGLAVLAGGPKYLRIVLDTQVLR